MRFKPWLLAVALIACTVPAESPAAPGTSAATPSGSASPTGGIARPTPTPPGQLMWRLDIPQSRDRYFVKTAPSGRVAVAADLDARSFTFFNLRGDQNGWSDARGLDLIWWTWLSDSSGLVAAMRATVDGRPTTQLVVFGYQRGFLTVLGEDPVGPDDPRLSPDGRWLAFSTKCCPWRIVASRLDGSDGRVLVTGASPISLLGWDADSRVMYSDSRQIHWVGLDATTPARAIDLGLPQGVNAAGARILEQSPDRAGAFIGIFADRTFPGAGSNNYGIRRLVGDRLYEVTSLGHIVGWLNDREFVESQRPPVATDIVTGSSRSLGVSDDQQEPNALSGRILLAQGNTSEMYVLRLGLDDQYRSLNVPGNLGCCPAPIGDGLFLFLGMDGWLYVLDGEVAAMP
jgi:dipeptidyl aminopeptidase/acylaminoacyl peptidase